MSGRDDKDSWGSDDFTDDVYSADFPPSVDDSSPSPWDTFVPDDSPVYDDGQSQDPFAVDTRGSRDARDARDARGRPAVPEFTDSAFPDLTDGQEPKKPQLPTLGSLPKGAVAICPIVGAADMIRGAILGGIFGALGGVASGYGGGLRGPFLRQHVMIAARSSSLSFSLWLGTFTGVKCVCAVSRGKKDIGNSFIGGAAAGMVAAIRTRNPRMMLMTSAMSGVLASVIDSL